MLRQTVSRFDLRQWILAVIPIVFSAVVPLGHAEIILDDFDNPFEIPLPGMQNKPYIMQFDIGPLSAERWNDVNVSSGGQATGSVNANLSFPSAMAIEITEIDNHPIGGPPAIGINSLYFFDEMDITEAGRNDRVMVDFAFLRSAIPMRRVAVFVSDATQPGVSFVAESFDVLPNEGPFTLEFPFSSFGIRGGGASRPEYERAIAFSLTISPTRFDDVEEIDFSAAVRRIRFGRAVPEPITGISIWLGVFGFNWIMARKRSLL
jgi:hypothetical protein